MSNDDKNKFGHEWVKDSSNTSSNKCFIYLMIPEYFANEDSIDFIQITKYCELQEAFQELVNILKRHGLEVVLYHDKIYPDPPRPRKLSVWELF